jgi:hypothetical protein
MWPSVVVHEHCPVGQRMIVEMGDYPWSEHIVTVFLTCQITIKNVQVQLTVKRKTTHHQGMRVRRPIKRPQLTLHHRHARFDWSHDHLGWTIRTWRRVHWSDESRFLLLMSGDIAGHGIV